MFKFLLKVNSKDATTMFMKLVLVPFGLTFNMHLPTAKHSIELEFESRLSNLYKSKVFFMWMVRRWYNGTIAQVFSCEICEVFQNAFFIEHSRWLPLNDGCTFNHKNTQISAAINSIADYNYNCKATLKCD